MAITTILLDLDNTLLGNEMDRFLPPYFEGLQESLRDFADGKDLRQLMIAATRAALANQRADTTIMDLFMAEFTQRLGHSIQAIEPALNTYYRQSYPKLQQFTHYRPAAKPIVDHLLADGYRVVIATNPLFPAVAIEQRLAWAGVAGLPYALVTSLENSHFAKPNPKYYREILATVKSRPEQAWMVGDDPINDIEPARSVGMRTWWITDSPPNDVSSKSIPESDRQGTLADFLAWIKMGGLKITSL